MNEINADSCFKSTSTVFMKRELLQFSIVQEFPNASSRTVALSICSVNCSDFNPQKNFKRYLVVSVFPDPLSPEITTDWAIL